MLLKCSNASEECQACRLWDALTVITTVLSEHRKEHDGAAARTADSPQKRLGHHQRSGRQACTSHYRAIARTKALLPITNQPPCILPSTHSRATDTCDRLLLDSHGVGECSDDCALAICHLRAHPADIAVQPIPFRPRLWALSALRIAYRELRITDCGLPFS